jgi:hypothetical protein
MNCRRPAMALPQSALSELLDAIRGGGHHSGGHFYRTQALPGLGGPYDKTMRRVVEVQLDGLAALVESGGVAERVPCADAHGVAGRCEVADELGSRVARPIAGERRGRRDVPINERLLAMRASKPP